MSIAEGVPAIRIPVDPLFLLTAPAAGMVFEAIERQARAVLGAEAVTLVETLVDCWVDEGTHLESECTNPDTVYLRWYAYQPSDGVAAAGTAPEEAELPRAKPERRLPEGRLASTPDPRYGHTETRSA